MNYESMRTTELRKLILEKGLDAGKRVALAKKQPCIDLLEGRIDRLPEINATQAESPPPPLPVVIEEVEEEEEEETETSTSDNDFVTGNGVEDYTGAPLTEYKQETASMNQSDILMEIILKNLEGKIGVDENLVIDLINKHGLNAEKANALLKNTEISMEKIIHERMKKLDVPVEVIIKNEETKEVKDMGIQHRCFVTLLKVAQARDKDGFVPNIYLHGPAGTGKTTGAKKLAEALNLSFYFNGAIDSEYKLSGFVDANGTFQSRPFFEAYKNGGVYLFDELDSSMPSAVLAFNASLANGHADFPVGKVERHKSCIIIGAGNTTLRGDGYNEGFQRNEMDGAFRDRFACFIEWPIDNALEQACCPYEHKHWLDIVRKARQACKHHGIKKHEVTPRATFSGVALLQAGLELDTVITMVLRKGLPDDTWSKMYNDIKEVM